MCLFACVVLRTCVCVCESFRVSDIDCVWVCVGVCERVCACVCERGKKGVRVYVRVRPEKKCV